jgi:hypothetical protein
VRSERKKEVTFNDKKNNIEIKTEEKELHGFLNENVIFVCDNATN